MSIFPRRSGVLPLVMATAMLDPGTMRFFFGPPRKEKEPRAVTHTDLDTIEKARDKRQQRETRRLAAAVKANAGLLDCGAKVKPYLWTLGHHKDWLALTRPHDAPVAGLPRYAATWHSFDTEVSAEDALTWFQDNCADLTGRTLAIVPKAYQNS